MLPYCAKPLSIQGNLKTGASSLYITKILECCVIWNNILIKYAGFIWPGAPWGFCGCKSQDIWLHDVLYPLIIYTLINYKTSDWAQDQFRTREVGLQNSPFWRIQPKLGWWRCDCITKQQLSMKSLIEGASCEACNDFSNIFDVLSQHLPLPNTSKCANQSFFLPSFLVPWTGGKHPIRPSQLYLVFFPMPPKSHLHVTEIILKDKMAMINYLLQRQRDSCNIKKQHY